MEYNNIAEDVWQLLDEDVDVGYNFLLARERVILPYNRYPSQTNGI